MAWNISVQVFGVIFIVEMEISLTFLIHMGHPVSLQLLKEVSISLLQEIMNNPLF